jgi:hypothetical protein
MKAGGRGGVHHRALDVTRTPAEPDSRDRPLPKPERTRSRSSGPGAPRHERVRRPIVRGSLFRSCLARSIVTLDCRHLEVRVVVRLAPSNLVRGRARGDVRRCLDRASADFRDAGGARLEAGRPRPRVQDTRPGGSRRLSGRYRLLAMRRRADCGVDSLAAVARGTMAKLHLDDVEGTAPRLSAKTAAGRWAPRGDGRSDRLRRRSSFGRHRAWQRQSRRARHCRGRLGRSRARAGTRTCAGTVGD